VPSVDVHAFVVANLPPPPARVLEVGAGDGELAHDLTRRGYDVVAIDPHGGEHVVPVALADLDAPPASFDAAVAVTSLHHVEPLEASVARLAEVARPGATLLVDEFDVASFDLRAATWLVDRWREVGKNDDRGAHDLLGVHDELHPLTRIVAALAPAFELATPTRGSYLYRWGLDDRFRAAEEEAIVAGELPAVGARLTARRRPSERRRA
jgi:SAM-dependent methyltransferase